MRTQTLVKTLILSTILMAGCGSSARIIPTQDTEQPDSGPDFDVVVSETSSPPDTGKPDRTIDGGNEGGNVVDNNVPPTTDSNDNTDCDHETDSNTGNDVVTIMDSNPGTDSNIGFDSNTGTDSNTGSDSNTGADSNTGTDSNTGSDACQPQDCDQQKCICEAFCNDPSQCGSEDQQKCLCECETAWQTCQAENDVCNKSCGR